MRVIQGTYAASAISHCPGQARHRVAIDPGRGSCCPPQRAAINL